MRRQHDRFLTAQQPGQHGISAGGEAAGEIGGEERQRPGQDVRQNEIMVVPAQPASAIAVGMIDPHQAADPVVRDIAAGDPDRSRIDVARPHASPQQLRRGDRQDPGAGADVEGARDPPPRQHFERHEAALGRRMLPGAKGGRGVERDPDCAGWHPASIM